MAHKIVNNTHNTLCFCENLKSIFRIEYIFLFIAIINFAFTVYYKYNASRVYVNLDETLATLQTKCIDGVPLASENLAEKFYAYTYFDNDFKQKIKELDLQIYSKEDVRSIQKNIIILKNDLYKIQKRLNFGYDSMLYCSLILVALSLIVLLYNNYNQQKEIESLKIHDEEQKNISRDLHDGVAQDLAALKLYLEKDDTKTSLYYAQHALTEIRYMIGIQNLDLSQSFESVLHEMFNTFSVHYGIKVDFFIASANFSHLSTNKRMELYRIFQEVLSNIARHSEATLVIIKITEAGNSLYINIKDNGKGFDSEKILSQTEKNNNHFGLRDIVLRVKEMNGTIEFINNGGSTIAIELKNIIC